MPHVFSCDDLEFGAWQPRDAAVCSVCCGATCVVVGLLGMAGINHPAALSGGTRPMEMPWRNDIMVSMPSAALWTPEESVAEHRCRLSIMVSTGISLIRESSTTRQEDHEGYIKRKREELKDDVTFQDMFCFMGENEYRVTSLKDKGDGWEENDETC